MASIKLTRSGAHDGRCASITFITSPPACLSALNLFIFFWIKLNAIFIACKCIQIHAVELSSFRVVDAAAEDTSFNSILRIQIRGWHIGGNIVFRVICLLRGNQNFQYVRALHTNAVPSPRTEFAIEPGPLLAIFLSSSCSWMHRWNAHIIMINLHPCIRACAELRPRVSRAECILPSLWPCDCVSVQQTLHRQSAELINGLKEKRFSAIVSTWTFVRRAHVVSLS